MATMSPDEAYFLGFVVETMLYGMYVVLFAMSLRILLGPHPMGKPTNGLLTSMTVLLFALCTAHFALNFSNKLQGLILKPGVVSISDETPELFAADIIVSITDFFGQLVLIYRCWLIWGRRYLIVIFPILIALASLACAMSGLGLLSKIDPTAPFAPPAVKPLGTASFLLALALNLLVTFLIIARIWRMARLARRVHSAHAYVMAPSAARRVRVAVGVMVESGVLYLAVQVVFVVLFAMQHPAQDLVGPMTVQVYGIAPTLIIVRVRMSKGDTDTDTDSSLRNSSARAARVSFQPERRHSNHSPYVLSPPQKHAKEYGVRMAAFDMGVYRGSDGSSDGDVYRAV